MSLTRFIELWTHPDYPPSSIDEEQLREVEARFAFALPRDYREAVLAHGLPRPTIALLDTIVDAELDVADVADFLEPKDMIRSSKDWHEIGLPRHLIAFATDCSGNLFCFSAENDAAGIGNASIHYFVHDFGTVKKVAPNFRAWIDEFCALAAS
jgi:hypothetical protein